MKDLFILFGIGFFFFITGFLLTKRDKKLFEQAIKTKATVTNYYEYNRIDQTDDLHEGIRKMYTLVVEYSLTDGTVIQAKEQSGSSRKKYPLGTVIDIMYSAEKPELFSICGDFTKKIALTTLMILGFGAMILSCYSLLTNKF